jgi:hypothetical protein
MLTEGEASIATVTKVEGLANAQRIAPAEPRSRLTITPHEAAAELNI